MTVLNDLNYDIIYEIVKYLDIESSHVFLNSSSQLYCYKYNMYSFLVNRIFKRLGILPSNGIGILQSKLNENIKQIDSVYLVCYKMYLYFKNHTDCDIEALLEYFIEKESILELENAELLVFKILLEQTRYLTDTKYLLTHANIKQKRVMLYTMANIHDYQYDFQSIITTIISIRDCSFLKVYHNLLNKTGVTSMKIMITKDQIKTLVSKGSFKCLSLVVELFLGNCINLNIYVKAVLEGFIHLNMIPTDEVKYLEIFLNHFSIENREKIYKIMEICEV
jgi:hypothetical protein